MAYVMSSNRNGKLYPYSSTLYNTTWDSINNSTLYDITYDTTSKQKKNKKKPKHHRPDLENLIT